ncbi:MAG: hypothetical protein ACE5MG_12800, partial [Candidatus Methylomirabilales bacterium]
MRIQYRSRESRHRSSLRLVAPIVGLCLSFVAVGCGRGDVEEKAVARPVKILTIGGPNSAG